MRGRASRSGARAAQDADDVAVAAEGVAALAPRAHDALDDEAALAGERGEQLGRHGRAPALPARRDADVAGVRESLAHELERALGDIDEDQPLRARCEHDAPAPAAGADLEHGAARGDRGEEDLVDERLLPLVRGGPLLAEPRPVPAVPALPVLGGGVVAPRAVGRAEHAARALDLEQRVLEALAEAPRRAQAGLGRDVARAEPAHAVGEGLEQRRALHAD